MSTIISSVSGDSFCVQETEKEVLERVLESRTGMIKLTRDNGDDSKQAIWIVKDNIVSFEEE
jgi:uncharacterized protein YlzI (FlbEa/FlbD family)